MPAAVACSDPALAPASCPTVMDLEASGFGRASYPIEVGYALPSGRTYCTLIRPELDWVHWDAHAESIHHISRPLIERRGLAASVVARQLNEDLRGQTVYSDGWSNDYTWLNVLYDAANATPSFRLESLRMLLSEEQADQWHTIKARISAERGAQRHRASADARMLQLTLQRVRNPA